MAYEEEPVHVSGHRLAVDTISECLQAGLRSCPASPSPPTPNLGPCINHWARRTESQRWVVGGKEGAEEGGKGENKMRLTLLLLHWRLFGLRETKRL